MKKRITAFLVTVVLAIAMFAGCGKDKGITIAVPNDTTNEARALLLLEELGYITLKEGAGITATVRDIAENPYNLTFNEVEAAQLPNVLQDVDYAVINGIRFPGNLALVNEAFSEISPGLRIVPSNSTGEESEVQTTNRNEPGATTLLDLTLKNKKIASLLIVDLAGELFEGQMPNSERGIFLDHADILIVMDSAEHSADEVVSIYNGLKNLQYLDGIKSLCHVITCMDKVMDKKIKYIKK